MDGPDPSIHQAVLHGLEGVITNSEQCSQARRGAMGLSRRAVEPKSVTHVLGMKCYRCNRNTPSENGAPGRV